MTRASPRRFLLRTENGLEGLMHPPAQFNIGADKGYLFYSRQPPFCRRCRRYGHNDGGCEEQRCLQCAQLGHIAKECTVPKSCHSCGSLDHLMRDCKVYSGQPQYCRRCQEFGHLEHQCNIRCLNCKDPGHAASECPKPKVCKECGATDHLFKTWTTGFIEETDKGKGNGKKKKTLPADLHK
uniref:CCHC-type domain-containing protein n=1 Tax=Cyprinus carpio carpio TaxID=630221 RepID=A0A9J7ZNB8_CYPCA